MRILSKGAIGAAAWTAVLAGALLGLDRWVAGPRGLEGWRPVAALADLPEAPWLPSYLPPDLEWPPKQVLLHPQPLGWWLRVDDADGPAVWIGRAEVAPPGELGDVAGCLETPKRCPRGWRRHLAPREQGPPVVLLTRLPPRELRRMKKTLGPRLR